MDKIKMYLTIIGCLAAFFGILIIVKPEFEQSALK